MDTLTARLYYIKREPTEEILTEERLLEALEKGIKLKHYIGFEISGYVHLGTGIVCMEKVADFQRAGIETNIFLADYHSWINKKLGGDLEVIRRVAGGYFKEALKICLKIVGGEPEKVNFILGSELYDKLGIEYLKNVIKISRKITLKRVQRSITIMGRKQGERVSFAQLLYVPMQVADLFSLGVNLPHGGMDQRKAHVIALEVWKEFGYKPIPVHHHLLLGLSIDEETRNKIITAKKEGKRDEFEDAIIDIKMSKSKPETAIFIHDSEEKIRKKIIQAYCPLKEVEFNPVIEILEYVIYPILTARGNFEGIIITNQKTGEKMKFDNISELKKQYMLGRIHPYDLKQYVAEKLIEILEPARKYFIEGKGRKYLEEMKNLKITR